MQGKKHFSEKLFTSFQLSERMPAENFYRRLKEVLDLSMAVQGYQKVVWYRRSAKHRSVGILQTHADRLQDVFLKIWSQRTKQKNLLMVGKN